MVEHWAKITALAHAYFPDDEDVVANVAREVFNGEETAAYIITQDMAKEEDVVLKAARGATGLRAELHAE
jgi:hypothetical protein